MPWLHRERYEERLWIILIILVGFGLRVHGFDYTGFWADEGKTGLAVRLDPAQSLSFSRQTALEHPLLTFARLPADAALIHQLQGE